MSDRREYFRAYYKRQQAARHNGDYATEPTGHRLDLGILIRYVELRHGSADSEYSEGQVKPGRLLTDAAVAHICGVSRVRVGQWRLGGGVPLFSADQVATHLGIHLLELWPDAYDDIDTEEAA